MELKYNANIDNAAIVSNLKRIINQIYKLLPNREEGVDWEKPLSTLLEEIAGMDSLLVDHHETIFPLMCKLEGLFTLTEYDDFQLFRRTVFECLNLVNKIIQDVRD